VQAFIQFLIVHAALVAMADVAAWLSHFERQDVPMVLSELNDSFSVVGNLANNSWPLWF
jgi:hypothetical protein